MKKLFIFLIISLSVCASVQASGLEKESQVKNAVETSMARLKKGSINDFIDSLRPIWNKSKAEIDTLKNKSPVNGSKLINGLGRHLMSNLLIRKTWKTP